MGYIVTNSITTLEAIKADYKAQVDALYTNTNTVWNKATGDLEDSLNNKIDVISEMIAKEKETNKVDEDCVYGELWEKSEQEQFFPREY